MARRALVLPPPWRRFAKPGSGTTCVVHPAVDCRATEALLAIALARATSGESVGLFLADAVRARGLLSEWMHRLKIRPRFVPMPGSYCVALGRSTLFVASARSLDGEGRFPRCDLLLAAGCDELPRNPLAALAPHRPRVVLFAGSDGDRAHWWHGFARGEQLERLSLDEVAAQWPEVRAAAEARARAKSGPPELPLHVFCRKRLYVRSSKGREFFDAEQLEQATVGMPTKESGAIGASTIVPFILSRAQRRYLALKELGRRRGKSRFLLLKYRRGGYTTLEQALQYRAATTRGGTFTATLAHLGASSERIFGITTFFLDHDESPPQVKRRSTSHLVFENGSQMHVGTAGGKGFARGDAFQFVHGSEVAKWCEGGSRRNAKVEEVVAGVVGAAEHGEVVFETTPNGVEWFCNTYRDAKKNLNEWWPIFLPWHFDPTNRLEASTFNAEEVLETLTDDEKELTARYGLVPAQVAWRRKKQREYGRLFKQECPEDDETCFIASGSCYFDTDLVLKMLERTKEAPRTHVPGGYEVRWKPATKGRRYVAGCDTSEGLPGCDPNGVGILDRESGEQVAAVHGLFNPELLAAHAVRLCREYNRAMLGVERENHGHAVLQHVKKLGYGTSHLKGGPLYHHVPASGNEASARAGWTTNEETRARMLDGLARAVESEAMKVRDRELLAECLSFRLQASGKFEADPGAHDDALMKWAIAWQMRETRQKRPRIVVLGDGDQE